MNKDISVLMSVYKNDIAENVKVAVESVINQTLRPKQIVMVVDGYIGDELRQVIVDLKNAYEIFEVVEIENNVGLGKALNEGSKFCKYDFIARMDSDDISKPDRFEKEMKCFENDEELSVVGSCGQEFFVEEKNLAGIKFVPQTHEEIVKFMRSRCPFCHMSVMIKKSILEAAGGYKHWHYAEDYYLWIRMFLVGAKFHNIQENLVNIRINYDTFERRSGLKYYKSIKKLLHFMKKNKIINSFEYFKECIVRFIGHVLISKKIRKILYLKYMRKK